MGFTACWSSEKRPNANKEIPTIPTNTQGNSGNNTQPVVIQTDNTNGGVNTLNAQVIKPTKMTVNPGRPASDNSEIFTELKDMPIETRVFKSHPQLVKVVKSGMPGKMTIKVYLKNGKVVDVPGDKFPNLGAETAASILDAVGIKPPQPPSASRSDSTKKPDQKQ
jgi:hypothetical protein